MKKIIHYSSISLFLLSLISPVLSKADDSFYETDLKTTCSNSYKTRALKKECVSFCAKNRAFSSEKYSKSEKLSLVSACQLGQIIYLKSLQSLKPSDDLDTLVENLKDVCRNVYIVKASSGRACKIGVTAEDLRKNPRKKGPGTSSDAERETGR